MTDHPSDTGSFAPNRHTQVHIRPPSDIPPTPPFASGAGHASGYYPAPPMPMWDPSYDNAPSGGFPSEPYQGKGSQFNPKQRYNNNNHHHHHHQQQQQQAGSSHYHHWDQGQSGHPGHRRDGGGYNRDVSIIRHQGSHDHSFARGGGRQNHRERGGEVGGGRYGRGGGGGTQNRSHPTHGAAYFSRNMLVDPWISTGMLTEEQSQIADKAFEARIKSTQRSSIEKENSKSLKHHQHSATDLFASLPPAKSNMSVPVDTKPDFKTSTAASLSSGAAPSSVSKFGSLLALLPKPQNAETIPSSLGTGAPDIVLSSTSTVHHEKQKVETDTIPKVENDLDLYTLLNQGDNDE